MNLTCFTEELFTNFIQTHADLNVGSIGSAGMLHAMADVCSSLCSINTGLAFLHTETR
ncbi:hypothetical protein ML401_37780 (plasmid) [Bradyrhizobium sp. 62B]|uniref:hypothetical protein n=1 Tax=Bradyrhizobium sp. 62B TaxID=2898442 RepID=UPI00255807C8|nr:hypothetical protein ML401_37780 [Bradyrhizobium sp. 62B]